MMTRITASTLESTFFRISALQAQVKVVVSDLGFFLISNIHLHLGRLRIMSLGEEQSFVP